MNTYSFKTGGWKFLVGVLSAAVVIVTFAGFADISIWGLLEQYVKPIVGTLTVGGLLAAALNAAKFHLTK